jgi:anti-sigma factor RsiW
MPSTPETTEPMSCEDVLDLLHCLIHNELEDEEAEHVLTHLAGCKSCRKALSEHVRLSGMLASNMPWMGKIYFDRYRSPFYH